MSVSLIGEAMFAPLIPMALACTTVTAPALRALGYARTPVSARIPA